LSFEPDDGIVVVMDKLTVSQYFDRPESLMREELWHGWLVREPAMPAYGHQLAVARLTALLYQHVDVPGLGVCLPGIDVVLDQRAPLIVQPDVLVVMKERFHIIRERVWGPPDLVIEILSPGTARRDRLTKLGWYRQYGVRECWLVDDQPLSRAIEVVDLETVTVPRRFTDTEPVRSYVLPDWHATPDEIFRSV
jgi:Uma2 family endonuclease